MILVIPVSNPDNPAEVDDRFGRAAGFVVIDTEKQSRSAISNPAISEPSGAGVKAARLVLDSGADAVAANYVGPKAEQILRSGKVEIFNLPPGDLTVERALELFTAGELPRQG